MKKVKRYVLKIITLFFIFLSIYILNVNITEVKAADTQVIDGFEVKIDNKEMKILGYQNKEIKKLIIPDSLDGMKVTKIENAAFQGYQYLEEIQLSNQLTKIGAKAFAGCIKLKNVTIPGSVQSIDIMAFYGCISLEEVYILYGVRSIGDGAFTACRNLRKVSFSPSADKISDRAFNSTSPSLTFAATAGSNAAKYIKENGEKPVVSTLPEDSPVVYDYTIDEKTGGVIIEEYYGDSKQPVVPGEINGDVVIGIGDGAFENKPIRTVKLPSTIRTIGANAFAGTGLTEIEIPGSVTAIGAGAFDDGSNLSIKGDSDTLDEYLSSTTKIKFVPYGPNQTLYHELKIKISPALGGKITNGVSREYKKGTSIPITAMPNQGYRFVEWTTQPDVNETNLENPNLYNTEFTMPNQDIVLTANFKQIPPEPLYIRNGVVLGYYGSDERVIIPTEWGKNGQEDVNNKVTVHTIGSENYSNGMVFYSGGAKYIDISKTITTIHRNAFWGSRILEEINVAEENENFSSEDGILFNKDKTELIYYPAGRKQKDYKIPESVNKIAPNAFSGNNYLESIDLNEVTKIDTNTFESCVNLQIVTMPKVQTIASRAFQNCKVLQAVSMPEVNTIGSDVFQNCKALQTVSMPKVQTIGLRAFKNCLSLQDISMEAVEQIDSEAFRSCVSLKVVSTAALKVVSPAAFQDCRLLEEVSMGQVQRISEQAFKSCTSLETVSMSAIKVIGSRAFENCTSLENITIPSSIEDIENYAFSQCYNLFNIIWEAGTNIEKIRSNVFEYCGFKELQLPNNIKKIEDKAFAYCNQLMDINIPASITEISSDSFFGCNNVRAFYVDEENIVYSSLDGVLFDKEKTTLMTYPIAKLDIEYKIPIGVSIIDSNAFAYAKLDKIQLSDVTKIKNSAFINSKITAIDLSKITSLGSKAFYNCYSLIEATLPIEIEQLGDELFYSCTNLTKIIVPENVKEISSSVFQNCSKLTEVILPESLQKIGGYTFSGCNSLKKINIPDNVEDIGNYTFYKCTSLEKIRIPANLQKIGDYAFSDCISLSDINFLDGIKKIGIHAFSNCNALKNLVIPASITSMGDYAFSNCTNLNSVKVSSGTTVIGNYAFYECINLSNLEFSDGLKTIGAYAFSKCNQLENITLPSGITTMGNYAFAACENLSKVTISSGVEIVGNYAFYQCKKLKEVQIPSTVETIGTYAFYECINLNNLEFSDGLKTIGAYAFSKCNSLEAINIPSGIITIGDYAFASCNSLEKADISSKAISNYEFSNCSSLKNIIFSDKLKTIGNYAFSNCSQLKIVEFPSAVNKIGEYAFSNCSEITELKFNESSAKIQKCAFEKCIKLENLVIPDTITSIEEYAFSECKGLTTIDAAANISNYAFQDCSKLETAILKTGVETIGNYAFKNSIIKKINLPDSVKLIGIKTFSGCNALQQIIVDEANQFFADVDGILYNKAIDTLLVYPAAKEGESYTTPDTIKRIRTYAFENANNLVNIYAKENVSNLEQSLFIGCNKINTLTIYNRETVFESSSAPPYESVFSGMSDVALSNLILVGYLNSTTEQEAFFRQAQKIRFKPLDKITEGLMVDTNGTVVGYTGESKTIIIPSSVTKDTEGITIVDSNKQPAELDNSAMIVINTIGTKAFWNPNNMNSKIQEQITDIKLPLSIRTIETSAFEDCISLTSDTFKLSLGIEKIKPYAFKNCVGLTTITIPKTVTLIGENAVPDETTDISVYTSAFYGCTNLASILVEEENTNYAHIDNGVLTNKQKNKIYEVPNGYKGNQAEEGHYIISNGITAIGDSAFLGCSLTNIEIPYTVEKIGAGTFRGVFASSPGTIRFRSNSSGNIKQGLSDLGNEAFKDCTGILSIELPATLERIGNDVFSSCTNLTQILVEEGNERYLSDEMGILYARGQETPDSDLTSDILHLIQYPIGKTEKEFKITDTRVKEIYESAFSGCTNLEKITLNDEIQIIGGNAFSNCANLLEVDFPRDLNYIGANAFANTNIVNVEIPPGIEEINDYAFANTKLSSLSLPENGELKKIGNFAFYNSYISEVTIPASVISIGENSFYSVMTDYQLLKVTFTNSETQIGNNAFKDTETLTIYGYENSTAQKYVENKNIKFELLAKTLEEEQGEQLQQVEPIETQLPVIDTEELN